MSGRKLWRGAVAVSFFVVAFGAAAQTAQAVVTTYSDRTAWNTAVGGSPDFLVDFSGFGSDTSFHTVPVDTGPFLLVQVGSGTVRNFIDAPPVALPDNNGTAHASMFTDFGNVAVDVVF